jgi:hypothetical protein
MTAWLPQYSHQDFKSDLIAALTTASMMIPQGLALAIVAGIHPVYGLYACIFPQIFYVPFATSRQLSVGPVAMSSLLVYSGIRSFLPADASIDTFTEIAVLVPFALTALMWEMGFLKGIIQVAMGILHVGFAINFISTPVMSGFTTAAAIMIGPIRPPPPLFKALTPQVSPSSPPSLASLSAEPLAIRTSPTSSSPTTSATPPAPPGSPSSSQSPPSFCLPPPLTTLTPKPRPF